MTLTDAYVSRKIFHLLMFQSGLWFSNLCRRLDECHYKVVMRGEWDRKSIVPICFYQVPLPSIAG